MCPSKSEVEEVIFSVVFWNFILSSVSKEDVTHDGFTTMQLDGEARSCLCCHRDTLVGGLLSRGAAYVSSLSAQSPSLIAWLRSCKRCTGEAALTMLLVEGWHSAVLLQGYVKFWAQRS